MVRRHQRQRSVWEVVLPDADKLWPADLRRIDTLLEDEAVPVDIAGPEVRDGEAGIVPVEKSSRGDDPPGSS